ncbi:MAG: exodeoxyribonuclease V subunit gamma [Planctomycetes bacterium]|nr:exodeoxyribonuclease V subunit gamma [Planctomycetota bacterium]
MRRNGLVIHTANRLEVLVAALTAELAAWPLPPLQAETILVPGQGMARWLTLELTARLGIAASLELPFPGAFLQHLTGKDQADGEDPFERQAMTWRIFRLLGDVKVRTRLGPAARYCDDDPDQRRRLQLAQRLAACLDDYQLWRDDVLRDWQRDEGRGRGDNAWQRALWRLLIDDTRGDDLPPAPPGGLPFAPGAAPEQPPVIAHRLEHLRERLAGPDARRLLPPRLHVFGAASLPPALLGLLQQISAHIPVTAWVPQPTPHWFGDHDRPAAGNPLLATLGRQTREFADLLANPPYDSAVARLPFFDAGTDTVLHTLQSDIANVRRRGHGHDCPPLPLRLDDESVRLHGCHAPLREVQVLRDQLLAAFAADRSLRPADVLVLVPDIERYAPLVHAVFGPVHDRLPFQVADRSPATALPLVATLLRVLELAHDRLAVGDVLHLLEEPAIARRFSLTASDLPALRSWTQRAGIRWGIDGTWRATHCQLPPIDDFAWEQGLQRLLLGTITGTTSDLVAGIAPLADTTDTRLPTLGRFVTFVRTLFHELANWQRPQPLPAWADRLEHLLDRLFDLDASTAGATALVRGAIAELRAQAATAALTEPVSSAVLHLWLQEHLQRLGDARGFLTGAITVAALKPMRAIPVRIVCIAGLDDASFPRRERPLPFDLLNQERRPGDRDVRDDDRQLFLDTLLAARQRLILTFVSRSQKDDSEIAPSVVVAELCDWLRAAFLPPAAAPRPCRDAVDWLFVQHPLQAFSERYLDGRDPRLFTYSGAERAVADAVEPNRPFALPAAAAVAAATTIVALDDLLRFWVNPSKWWLRNSLQVRLPDRDDDPDEIEPFTIDNLQRWSLQDEFVRQAWSGTMPADGAALAHARGRLPPGQAGTMGFVAATAEAAVFVKRLARFGELRRQPVRVVGDGFEIHGELSGVTDERLVLGRMARLKNKDQLRAWIQHLVFAATRLANGQAPLPTLYVARANSLQIERVSDPLVHLRTLVNGYVQGQGGPLPFFEQSSHEYAKKVRRRDDRPVRAARQEWLPKEPFDGKFIGQGDSEDPWIALCTRDRDPLTEPEFARWAIDVWDPILTYAVECNDAL